MATKQKVHKAVILVAGYGTRILPATKAQPKEMLPVVDKPAVQYMVEQLVEAGIRDIVFVTGAGKRAIEDHFDSNVELELRLKQAKKTKLLREVQRITNLAHFVYVRQSEPLGTGHAVLTARPAVGNEPFLMLYPDDLIVGETNPIAQMLGAFDKHQTAIMSVLPVPRHDIHKYGILRGQRLRTREYRVEEVVEKPTLRAAPSNLASLYGYIFTPEIFTYLKKIKRGRLGEIVLADAITLYLKRHTMVATELRGQLFDLGSKLGLLKANVAFGLRHPEFGAALRTYIRSLL